MPLPNGQARVQRIEYLAEARNRLLRPLDPAYAGDETPGFQSIVDLPFDKILFLNDVFFSPLDAAQLLFSTNDGAYRAACAIDFIHGVMFYDTFVVRDTEGYGMGVMFYPWFSTAGSRQSREDVRSEKDAVRVRSCWGGMAAFEASVFRPGPDPTSHQSLPSTPVATGRQSDVSPVQSSPAVLQFRGSGEPFWEAAECCLIFADMELAHGAPNYTGDTGVFINPYIRVAYTQLTFNWLHFYRRFERSFEYLQSIVSWIGYPEYNPRRTHEPGAVLEEVAWEVPRANGAEDPDNTRRKAHFSHVQRVARPGGFCGQRRMFVMKQDVEKANTAGAGKNWEKVPVPWGSGG